MYIYTFCSFFAVITTCIFTVRPSPDHLIFSPFRRFIHASSTAIFAYYCCVNFCYIFYK